MNKKEWKEKNEQEKKKKLEELTEMFRKYGANNPESWARSVVNPEIKPYKTNQLTRFSLLKALTSEVLKESDTAWVELQLSKGSKNEGSPLSQLALQ